MRVAIIPGLVELRIKVNPAKKVTRKGLPYIVMPWMFAPWPKSKEKGVVEIVISSINRRNNRMSYWPTIENLMLPIL